jgi:hypothetical protein
MSRSLAASLAAIDQGSRDASSLPEISVKVAPGREQSLIPDISVR